MVKRFIEYIVFIGFLYLFLFNPPYSIFRGLFGVGNFIVLASIVFAIAKPRHIRSFISHFKKEYSLLVILFIYVLFRTIVGGERTYLTRHFLGICNFFLVIPMILYYAKSIGLKSEEQIIKSVLVVGTVAAFVSIICLVTPSLNEYVRNNLLRLEADDYLALNTYRGFGYANMLTSDYGFVLGLIAGYGSMYLKDNKFFYFCIPLLLFAAIINARTGALLAIIIISLSVFVKKRLGYGLAIIAPAVLLVSYYDVLFDLIGVDARTVEFSLSLFKEAQDVIQGNVEGSYAANELFNNMIVFPPSILEWVVGRGYSIVKGGSAGYSDVGWILQLNYGGLIYITILYLFFLTMIRRLRIHKKRTCMWTMIMYILLINTKSSIFPGYSSFYLLFMFYAIKLLPEYNGIIKQEDKTIDFRNHARESLVMQ